MCGIAGFLDLSKSTNQDELERLAKTMADTLHHRGPDASDVWGEAKSGAAFAHARLSVIDLSPAGAQPMVSACGRYVIVYNGEVYETEPLRQELRTLGVNFKGHSDTEVIIEGCAHWGIKQTIEKLIGMFAFALWDRHEKRLTIVRDRLGIKPLYWGQVGQKFVFGSELKAFKTLKEWQGEVDSNTLSSYLRFNYVPSPLSIYKNVHKLAPGHILTLDEGIEPKIEAFWSLADVARNGIANPTKMSDAEATDALDDLLRRAVKGRMVADVPLGAFLSGGIDSSTVVALMQAQSDRPIQTFSIGVGEPGYNEAEYAKAVAAHLKTDHTELYVSPQDALDVIPNIASWYDEPFADSSQIPTYLVSKLARQHVTVALSGDGGDEFFSGYNRYFWGDKIWNRVGPWPVPVRRAASCAMQSLSPDSWNALSKLIPAKVRPSQFGDKIHKVADILGRRDSLDMFRRLISCWDEPDSLVLGATEPKGLLWDDKVVEGVPEFMEQMQLLDGLTYLPDDILTKVDRASMQVSLEARVPLLDHRVCEFAFGLPRHMRVRDGKGKWLLRQVLHRYVPEELIDRPKMGFGIPIGQWLRGPLRDWAEDLLSVENLTNGQLVAKPIRDMWDIHLSGKRNSETALWTVLMYQAWRQKWIDS